ncbi:hypothetical protein AMECASPLE_024934 [Ameca splendens]|uniref:Uncharacterized protein n=1 Tax=Ameca splendens TaxID=208324 RepID=A0ABV0YGN4_9TELE
MKGESLTQSQFFSSILQVLFKDHTLSSSIHLPSALISLPVPAEEKSPRMMLPPPCFTTRRHGSVHGP